MNNSKMQHFFDTEDSLKNEFKKVFSEIKASEDLKSNTLKGMLEKDKSSKGATGNALGRKNRIWRYGIPAAAALVCAVLVIAFWPGKSGAPYVTLMEEGVYYDSVELEDGEIHFVANRVAVSITPNAGGIVIGEQSTEDEESTEHDPGYAEVLLTDDGGMLVFEEAQAVSLPQISEKNWSYIGEQMIYVTVLKTEEVRYQAVFEKDGTAYEVIGSNVTQKEFIDFLYEKIK